jgi:hypothetical protein
MKTIAITTWNKIVSPLYDASCSLVIIKPDTPRLIVNIREMTIFEKASRCASEGVQVLICGAISSEACAMLIDNGIQVYSWIRGPVDELLEACKKNVNLVDHFSMPGCGKKMCNGHRGLNRKCGRRSM